MFNVLWEKNSAIFGPTKKKCTDKGWMKKKNRRI